MVAQIVLGSLTSPTYHPYPTRIFSFSLFFKISNIGADISSPNKRL